MYCTNCGNKLDSNATHCSACGIKTKLSAVTVVAPTLTTGAKVIKKHNSLLMTLGIIAVLAFAVLLFAIVQSQSEGGLMGGGSRGLDFSNLIGEWSIFYPYAPVPLDRTFTSITAPMQAQLTIHITEVTDSTINIQGNVEMTSGRGGGVGNIVGNHSFGGEFPILFDSSNTRPSVRWQATLIDHIQGGIFPIYIEIWMPLYHDDIDFRDLRVRANRRDGHPSILWAPPPTGGWGHR